MCARCNWDDRSEGSAVVRPRPTFVLHSEVEQPIDNRVQDDALRAMPRAPRALGIEPDVEDLLDRRGDRPGHGDISEIHRGFSSSAVSAARNASSRSMRNFQNCSYVWIHRATSRRGSASNSSEFSRPRRVRRTSPARSSTFTCLQNPVSDIEKGLAISEMRAGPRASRSMILLRVGSEMAAATRSILASLY